MPRPQFTLRALLVAMLAICCFLAGMATQRALDDWKYREVFDHIEWQKHFKD